jgi:hypothetical protein
LGIFSVAKKDTYVFTETGKRLFLAGAWMVVFRSLGFFFAIFVFVPFPYITGILAFRTPFCYHSNMIAFHLLLHFFKNTFERFSGRLGVTLTSYRQMNALIVIRLVGLVP